MSDQGHNKQKSLKSKNSIATQVFHFVSGLGLSVSILIVLGLIVWFSTLEQSQVGLSAVSEKYYSHKVYFVRPTLYGNDLFFKLPGAYWTCAALFINMSLGGILRIRKGVKQIGIIIAHLGILSLLLVGAIDYHRSIYGHMDSYQTGVSDYAWKEGVTSIETFAYDSEGKKQKPFVIKNDMLDDLDSSKMRKFTFAEMPFDLEVRHFMENANIMDATKSRHSKIGGPIIDGFYLKPAKVDPKKDLYYPGCYVTVRPKDGSPSQTIMLSRQIPHPQTFSIAGTIYGIEMPNEIWKLPFRVKLKESKGEYYPGTRRPSYFSSDIIWKGDDGIEHRQLIEMNKPMRYGGYTLFQASWNPPADGVQYSGFKIVTNPAEMGPEICLWVTAFGLFFHFIMMLVNYIEREMRKAAKSE